MTAKQKLFFILLCILSFNASAQEKYPSTLLWRISGKKLTAPSYLYGTIHLKDKRLFFFGDSLYNAIETTKGFAMEIDPDEMLDSLYKALEQKDKSALLKSIMDKEKYKKVADRLAKKMKMPAEKITLKQFSDEKDKWMYKSSGKDDMQTPMDLYLYNIARKQGKITGGIEDVGDQMGVLDDFSLMDIDAFVNDDTLMQTNFMEQMKKMYIARDLDGLNNMINRNYGEKFKDLLLIKRNIKMASRIDSILNLRTNFFAVGAAHLPGETGLIQLLQKNGYVIEPVFASEYIDPVKYKYIVKEMQWQTVGDKDSIISVSMPGRPTEIMAGGEVPMKMYVDLADMNYYGLSVNRLGEGNNADSVFNKMTRNYKSMDMEISGIKNIEYKGYKGKEMTASKEGENYFRCRLFVKGTVLAIVIFGGSQKEMLHEANAERFFSSFNFNEITETPDKRWLTLSNIKNAFSIEFPGKAIAGKEKSDDGTLSDKYSLSDMTDGSYYSFIVKDFEPGYHIPDDSSYFEDYRIRLNESIKPGVNEFSIGSYNGYPSCDFTAIQKEGNEEYVLKGKMIIRGGRLYIPMIAAPKYKADFPEFTHFFRSLNLLPFTETGWKEYQFNTGAFSTMLPEKLYLPKKDTLSYQNDIEKYIAADKNTGLSFMAEVQPLSPYYWAASDTGYFRKKLESFKNWNDSVISYNYYKAPIKSASITFKISGADVYKRFKIFLNGDTLYTLYSFQPGNIITNNYFNSFFDSIKLPVTYPVTIFNNKAQYLLNALQSSDSTTNANAYSAFVNVEFTKADLPLLYEYVIKKYPHNVNDYRTTNEELTDEIIKLQDSSAINFVTKHYYNVNDTSADIKLPLLTMLANLKTEIAFATLKKLLLDKPPATGDSYNMFKAFSDTMSLTKMLFPDLCSLYSDSLLGPGISNLVTEMLDSNAVDKKEVLQNENGLHNLALSQLKAVTNDSETYLPYNSSVIDLLRRFNSKQSNELISRFARIKSLWIKNNAVLALLKNNQPVLPADIMTFAKDRSWRTGFYEDLKRINKTGIFPKEYYSQAKFSESYLYNFLTDEYEMEVEKVQFLKTATAKIDGVLKKYFIYKIMNTDADVKVWQLAFCGPFNTNNTNPEISYDELDVFVDDENDFDPAQTDNRFKKYIADKLKQAEQSKK